MERTVGFGLDRLMDQPLIESEEPLSTKAEGNMFADVFWFRRSAKSEPPEA